ncbi:MAG TPA: hypothetical protein VI072_34605 [Polyangiaceae bacterium]
MTASRAIWRLLTFRITVEEFMSLGRRHLVVGLLWTWIVGMGRWWDDPDARLLQHLGLGSVLYVGVLSALLWVVVLPLRPRNWTFTRVLTFVSMTSPPALLYAIPVEQLLEPATAGRLNLWFLAAVALWRVALLLRFLSMVPRLGTVTRMVTALLPLSAIVSSLAALNLHRVVFRIMGGIAEHEKSVHDAAYSVLVFLTFCAVTALPILLVLYVAAIVHRRKRGISAL